MTVRHCRSWPASCWRGCPMVAGKVRWVIPMVDSKSMRRMRHTTMRAAAEKCHADHYGHPPAHTVVAKVATPAGAVCRCGMPRRRTGKGSMRILNTTKTLKEKLEECFGALQRPPWINTLNRDGKTMTSGYQRNCGSGIIRRHMPPKGATT